MVDEPVVGHGLAIGVGVHRFAEDLGGVFGRCGGHADFHGVKVVEHTAVAGEVLALVAHRQLAFGHFLVQGVAAVGLIDDDAVEFIHQRR